MGQWGIAAGFKTALSRGRASSGIVIIIVIVIIIIIVVIVIGIGIIIVIMIVIVIDIVIIITVVIVWRQKLLPGCSAVTHLTVLLQSSGEGGASRVATLHRVSIAALCVCFLWRPPGQGPTRLNWGLP